jgi:hypothetical protein
MPNLNANGARAALEKAKKDQERNGQLLREAQERYSEAQKKLAGIDPDASASAYSAAVAEVNAATLHIEALSSRERLTAGRVRDAEDTLARAEHAIGIDAADAAYTKARDAFDAFEDSAVKAKTDLEQKLAAARAALAAAQSARMALPFEARDTVKTHPHSVMHLGFPDNALTAAQSLIYSRERAASWANDRITIGPARTQEEDR